jgi:preprotein translocase subunit YajC
VIDLAYAMPPSPPGGGGGPFSMLIQLVPMLLVFAIFFFLLIRPQQREKERRRGMLANLKKGDRVVTSGGLIGTIVGLNDRTVTLRVADAVRVECLRDSVNSLFSTADVEKESA